MITEKMIQINQWGICRNFLQRQWLNLFCVWAQETRWTSKYLFLTLSPCTTLSSAKGSLQIFLEASCEMYANVMMPFWTFCQCVRICVLLQPTMAFCKVQGDVWRPQVRHYFSEGSLLAVTMRYFDWHWSLLFKWISLSFTLIFSKDLLKLNCVPAAGRSEHLPLSALDNLST